MKIGPELPKLCENLVCLMFLRSVKIWRWRAKSAAKRCLVPTIVPTSYLYFPRIKKHVAFLNQNNLVFSAFLGIIWTFSVNTGYLSTHNKQNGEKNQTDKQNYKCNWYLGEYFALTCKPVFIEPDFLITRIVIKYWERIITKV